MLLTLVLVLEDYQVEVRHLDHFEQVLVRGLMIYQRRFEFYYGFSLFLLLLQTVLEDYRVEVRHLDHYFEGVVSGLMI